MGWAHTGSDMKRNLVASCSLHMDIGVKIEVEKINIKTDATIFFINYSINDVGA